MVGRPSKFRRVIRKFVAPTIVGVALVALAGVNAVNAALPGGGWGPIYSKSGSTNITGAQGTFRGIVEDRGLGTRAETNYKVREVSILTHDRRGAYAKSNFYFDAHRCYVSSFSIPGGAGVTCSSGWWSAGSIQGPSIKGSTWSAARYMGIHLNPSGNSVRFQLRGCLDRPIATDLCSGAVLRGAAY